MTATPGRTYAIGQAFNFPSKGYAFQNFRVDGSVNIDGKSHTFLPFGFSGVTISRTGDNVDASLVLPNSALAQAFALTALDEEWLVSVKVGSFNPASAGSFAQVLYEYRGLVSAGGWDDTSIRMVLNSVLDAVTGDIPHRVFESDNVGPLPITANIRLQ